MAAEADKKEEIIRDLKSKLSAEQRKKSFDMEELRKDNNALQKRIDMLDNDLEEKSNQVLQMTCESEDMKEQLKEARTKMESLVVENSEIKSKMEKYEKIIADVEQEKQKMTAELKNAN